VTLIPVKKHLVVHPPKMRETMNKTIHLLLFCVVCAPNLSYAQSPCVLDFRGIPFCAPPGGSAISTVSGVVCSVGRCVINNQGYPKCSSIENGGATRDNQGNVFCLGECINPTKEQCLQMKGEKK